MAYDSALILRLPRQDEEQEFLSAHLATTPEVPYFLHAYHDGMPFTDYIEVLAAQARGERLEAGHVPATFLFAFANGRIVGRVSIRHRLNDFLLRVGGHIGYVVVRSSDGRVMPRRFFDVRFASLTSRLASIACW